MLSIKIQLIAKSIKQNDIAARAGVHKSYISNVLAGRDKPSKKVVRAFEYFGIKVEKND